MKAYRYSLPSWMPSTVTKGKGNNALTINRARTPEYMAWCDMLRRCYSPDFLSKNPSYKGCSVDERWHNFQHFADWHKLNYSKDGLCSNGFRYQLDKDLIHYGNKIYSPERCVFVSRSLNTLFAVNKISKSPLPMGLSWHGGSYRVCCGLGSGDKAKMTMPALVDGKENKLLLKAAIQAYWKIKSKVALRLADEYPKLREFIIFSYIRFEREHNPLQGGSL